ncbi:MAG: Helicase associated domain protein, partial [Eubacteriales bacterium]|nr:Helicase associated domain protein [Eubacteriales bacterium]
MSIAVKTGIELFSHNQQAYESAVSMLAETGKAAIIHPTGTGKSFIGFKLAEDNPDKVICWLSPSEYIFKTQIENLAATGADEPENIKFFTYAKLMLMSEDELAEIQPDEIIIDEFHRVGAQAWGLGVQKLLAMYPDAPILGLSATNIRYLDNQRDMADELFDGNVASEMTLGEAIVRGILNAPKYVLSIFSYQKELEKYEKRIRNTRNKAIRDPAERYLDALRHTLELADGIDEIFNKHMTNRTGKYIVFCANYDHMQEMMDKASAWFAKVDRSPSIYSVYSSDPSASQSFQSFKEDTNDDHLRLLYCIDALNEGIHLDDISGVILLRPTVSPIIFKQQIGRTLSASKKTDSVIFDIVLNIENLYSIGAVEEEMQIATAYYRSIGENEAIVNEHFKVIDELRDCISLFEKLNDTLTASWEIMFQHARSYFLDNGDLEIPAKYITEDGYSLGHWIYNQRSIRKGLQEGSLSDDRIAKLDAIGMRWDLYTDVSWERNFAAAEAYFHSHGNLDVYSRYVTDDGVQLGTWLCSLRTWERAGAHPKYLTDERKKQLEAVGMIWDKLDFFWEQNYQAAWDYFREHRNLDIPSSYITKDGIRLGSWICRLRKLREGKCRGLSPSEEQIARLDKIGMIWKPRIDHKWQTSFESAAKYAANKGNLNVPVNYIDDNGINLGAWIQRQRAVYKQGKISEARKKKLESIGMVWDTEPWLMRFETVKKYYFENHTMDIPQALVINGFWVGKWIVTQKRLYDKGGLTEQQRKCMEQLPLDEVDRKDKQWISVYKDAADYYKEYLSLRNVPSDYVGNSGSRLADWIIRQRRKWNLGELSTEQIQLLDEIHFIWTLESAWDEGFRHAKDFFDKSHHLSMPNAYKSEDGYALGRWVFNYRKAHNGKKSPVQISGEQTAALESIGMEWNPDTRWDTNYELVKQYCSQHDVSPLSLSVRRLEEKKLACWLNNQRKSYRLGYLSPNKLLRLAEIGVTEQWLLPKSAFDKGYAVALDYFKKNGNLNIATDYQHENGFWLGSWIDKIRKKKSELTEEQIKQLDAIGFVWISTDRWEERFQNAEDYYSTHGELPLEPKQCRNSNELYICQWLRRQILRKNEGKMPQEQIERLSAIGMDWMNAVERSWQRGY